MLRTALLLIGSILCLPLHAAENKPNIVVLLADDLGWTDLHTGATSNGNGTSYHQTPNIDRLAEQGMSFTSMYMCPNCAPSRAAYMTGQYAARNGVYNVTSLDRGTGNLIPADQHGQHIRPDAVTVAATLKTAGYTTCQVAKFHVASHEDITKLFGFDFNYGGGHKGDGAPAGYLAVKEAGHWSFKNMGQEMDQFATPYTADYIAKNLAPYASGNAPATLVGTRKHLTDATADAAVDFISKHHDKPFFINVAFNAVHVKLVPRADLLKKWNKIKSDDPRHDRPDYAALLEGEDQAIGRILHELDADGLTQNTIVIFLSDNGGFSGSTSNAPLRAAKGTFYEGGLRVPLIVDWPGVTKPGATNDTMLNNTDLYPTFAKIAGAKLPDPAKHPLDGFSFANVLRGESSTSPRDTIYYHFPGYLDTRAYPCSVIIKQLQGTRYKLWYSYEDQHYELYDLTNDLSEKHNLLNSRPSDGEIKLAEELRKDLAAWLDRSHPLQAKTKSGEVVPPPIEISEALRAGNKQTRKVIVPQTGSD